MGTEARKPTVHWLVENGEAHRGEDGTVQSPIVAVHIPGSDESNAGVLVVGDVVLDHMVFMPGGRFRERREWVSGQHLGDSPTDRVPEARVGGACSTAALVSSALGLQPVAALAPPPAALTPASIVSLWQPYGKRDAGEREPQGGAVRICAATGFWVRQPLPNLVGGIWHEDLGTAGGDHVVLDASAGVLPHATGSGEDLPAWMAQLPENPASVTIKLHLNMLCRGSRTGLPSHLWHLWTRDRRRAPDDGADPWASRAVLLLDDRSLRRLGTVPGEPLTWEDAIQSVRDGIDTLLRQIAPDRTDRWPQWVVVRIGSSGAVVICPRKPAGATDLLYFDPYHQSGDWERGHPGTVLGHSTCFVAAIVAARDRSPAEPDWDTYVRRALLACRYLHWRGLRGETCPAAGSAPAGGHGALIPVDELGAIIRNVRAVVADTAYGSKRALATVDGARSQGGTGEVQPLYLSAEAVGVRIRRRDASHSSREGTVPLPEAGAEDAEPDGTPFFEVTVVPAGEVKLSSGREPGAAGCLGSSAVPSSILGASLAGGRTTDRVAQAVRTAELLVRLGTGRAALRTPVETLGTWRSVDVAEIHGVRSVLAAARQYLQSGPIATPIGIALFGPPGCGKSFVLAQIAGELAHRIEFVEFNLSQLSGPERLTDCFHRIQAIALRGKVPLVLWDEFDTPLGGEQLGWLRHFLAPLEDGHFGRSGEQLPTGAGIYAFVGGTSHSYAEFSAPALDTAADDRDRTIKKPDFISRLAAYMDVMGPNPTRECVSDGRYCLRRAVLLRQLWEHMEPDREDFRVDPGLLHAFLMVGRYRHGSRSLKAILQSAYTTGMDYLDVASLPPRSQLDLHVNADEFLDLARRGCWRHVRVGAFGHRDIADWPEEPIRQGLRDLVERVAELEAVQEQNRGEPPRAILLTVFCTLARGVDTLVADEVGKLAEAWRGTGSGAGGATRGIRLVAVLPRVEQAYRNDRMDDESDEQLEGQMRQLSRRLSRVSGVIELYRPPADEEGYSSLAQFLTDHCDWVISATSSKHRRGRSRGDVLCRVLAHARGAPDEPPPTREVQPAGQRGQGVGDLEIALHKVVRNAPTSS